MNVDYANPLTLRTSALMDFQYTLSNNFVRHLLGDAQQCTRLEAFSVTEAATTVANAAE